MATEAHSTFETNVKRASWFLDIHEWAQGGGRGAPLTPLRELPRGAVVFAVGALDAYLSEVSAEVLVAQLQTSLPGQETRELLKRVQGEIPTLALEVALLPGPHERTARIKDAVTDYFHNRVSQHGAKAVSATVQRLGGKPADVWSAIGSKGSSDPQTRLDTWTDVRHQIVHQGKKPSVTRKQARRCIELLMAVAEEVDKACERLVSC